nr:hypothetical protein [Bartonella sp. ML70XJBT.G]
MRAQNRCIIALSPIVGQRGDRLWFGDCENWLCNYPTESAFGL